MKKSVSKDNIKNIAEEALYLISEGKKPNLYQLQQKHGYSESSARSYKVLRTKAWQEIMADIEEEEIIHRFKNILKEGSDKDAIAAGKELMSWKYPKHSVTESYKKTIKDLLE